MKPLHVFCPLLLALTACKPDRLPYVDFRADLSEPCYTPCEVAFNVSSDSEYDSLRWAFGDGTDTLTTEVEPGGQLTHTYTDAFPDGVTVNVTAYLNGESFERDTQLFILAPGDIFVDFDIAFLNDSSFLPTTVSFTNQSLPDSIGNLSYSWELRSLQNGQSVVSSTEDHVEGSPWELTFSEAPLLNGMYEVSLTARRGGEDLGTKVETFEIRPKVGLELLPTHSCTKDGTQFFFVDSTLAFQDVSQGKIDRYRVDWGDGSGWQESESFSDAHVYAQEGSYEIEYAVEGNGVPSDTFRTNITIAGRNVCFECGDVWVDERDGKGYETVVVVGDHGYNECWFAENLEYGERITDGSELDALDGIPQYFTWDGEGGMYVFDEVRRPEDDLENLGERYSIGGQGICPDGWHIPSDGEWLLLEWGMGMPESIIDDKNAAGWDRGDSQIAGRILDTLALTGPVRRLVINAVGDVGADDSTKTTASFLAYSIWSPEDTVQQIGTYRELDLTADQGVRRQPLKYNHAVCIRCIKD